MEKTKLGKGRERILVYGQPGVGKTYMALSILDNQPKTRAYYIDTDDGVERTLLEFPDEIADRIDYYLCHDFEEIREAFDQIRSKIKSQDWLFLESCGQVWDMAQQYYIEQVFKEEIGDFYLEQRKRLEDAKQFKRVAPLDGWKDWSVIKKLHNEGFMDILTKRIKCNVLATTTASRLNTTDDSDVVDLYNKVGYRPEGEKRNGYRFDIILFLSRDRRGKYFVEAVKNRGRKLFGRTPIDEDGAYLVYEAESF